MSGNLCQDDVLEPKQENAPRLLHELGLLGLPSREKVHEEIERELLSPGNTLPQHWLPTYQIHWEHELSIPSLLTLGPSPAPTSLAFVRSGLNGRVTGYKEVTNPRLTTGLTSTSLTRAPGPSTNFVRGKSGHVPFWPGGLEDILKDGGETEGSSVQDGERIRIVPPGFTRGLKFDGEPRDDVVDIASATRSVGVNGAQNGDAERYLNGPRFLESSISNVASDIDELLPASRAHLKPATSVHRPLRRSNIQKRDWAHEIDVKKSMPNFHELVPDMARKYPFELDTFQKQAIYHLEMGDSVFVAAHTSAGKTVVAEYAIALAEKHMTRAIYTSPIKALSNQKYRDFKQTFSSSSVGILTGDVQINPEGNCLIMTTEILRSMLYKGADLIRDVEFVIFDEVHYVNDAERGVVWEEVIIMLPDHVNIILLSATVPNTKEFADWVGRTKKKDIYVISTPKRPVPLEHYLYAKRELFKIVDASRQFLTQGYKEAGEALRRKQDKEREAAGLPPVQRLGARAAAPQRGQRGGTPTRGGQRGAAPARGGAPVARGGSPRTFHQPDKNLYVHLIDRLRKDSLLPVVIFTLSKKRCEENAATLTKSDFCTAVEKSEIHVAISKALSRLKDADQKLPQILRMIDLLTRGIGVHHGGLLPIVKEVVEILFARGLVKALFATETFAMGVNMPTRCVVFSNTRKHDGRSFRDILAGEYTQMAGRAGRRGLDATGTVIVVVNDELPEQTTLNTMILGTPSKLQSQFRLTYNMILNLLRVEALRVEEMIKRSFSENATQRLLPDQMKQIVENEKKLSKLTKLSCEICATDIERHYSISLDIVEHNQTLLMMAAGHPQGANILSAGRVIVLRDGHFKWNLAVLLRPSSPPVSKTGLIDKGKYYWILALVDPEQKQGKRDVDDQAVPPMWPPKPTPCSEEKEVTYELKAVPLTSISMLLNRSIQVQVGSIMNGNRTSIKEAIEGLRTILAEWRSTETILEVDWRKMRSLDFQETLRRRNAFAKQLEGAVCTLCENFDDHYFTLHSEKSLAEDIANLKQAVSDQNLELVPDYEQRIKVLKDLKFIDDKSTVLLKGRVACEINSADELVLTELILENTLASYEPEEVVALLSCFVFQEKTNVEPVISPKLQEGRDAIIAIAERVGAKQDYHKVPRPDFRVLKFGLMEAVYEWAKGMPFKGITELTDVPEGTIVRVITRLDECCREVRDAARVIGDAELFKKMEEAQIKIKRDIIFAASLYF